MVIVCRWFVDNIKGLIFLCDGDFCSMLKPFSHILGFLFAALSLISAQAERKTTSSSLKLTSVPRLHLTTWGRNPRPDDLGNLSYSNETDSCVCLKTVWARNVCFLLRNSHSLVKLECSMYKTLLVCEDQCQKRPFSWGSLYSKTIKSCFQEP